MSNVTDISGELEANRKNSIPSKIIEVLQEEDLNRAEILGVLELVKLNLFTEFQIEEMMNDEDDNDE